MNNISYYQIIYLLSLTFVIIISFHSFTTTTTIYHPLSNNNQFIIKTFAKESKNIQLDEKLLQKELDLVKEIMGISNPINSIKNSSGIITQVYPSLNGGEEFRLNKTNPNDMVQVDETKKDYIFTKQNEDESWRIDEGRPRIDIYTKDAGILSDTQILDKNLTKSGIQSWNYSELKDIGYWYKPSDWKNVEVTLIFKLIDSSRSDGEEHALSVVTRSISHSEEYKKKSDNPPFYCGGSSYHNNLSNEGKVRMKKEQFHVDYEREKYNPSINLGDLYDKIIGFKAMVYNINSTAVKMETWIDVYNDGIGPYVKLHEKIDNGEWGDSMKICGAEKDGQAITWGSPTIIIKANDFKFDVYDVEIREIIPPTIVDITTE